MEPSLETRPAAPGQTLRQFQKDLDAWRQDSAQKICNHHQHALRRGSSGLWEPNREWIHRQADLLFAGMRQDQWLYEQACKQIEAEIQAWLMRPRSLSGMDLEIAPDAVLIQRPVTDDNHWETAQSLATEALYAERGGYTLPILPPQPQTWRNYRHLDFYATFFHKDAFEHKLRLHPTYIPHNPETSWIRGLDRFWAMALVALEGAITAYLQVAGFGLDYWREVLGWKKLSSPPALHDIPAWKWHLLREAYVVAWLWGLAFVIYSLWSPLDADCQSDLRQALMSLAAMMGWRWGLRPLRWRGRDIKIYSHPDSLVSHFHAGAIEVKNCAPFSDKANWIIDHLIAEETAFQGPDLTPTRSFQYQNRENKVDTQDSRLIWAAARPSSLIYRPGVFRRDNCGDWVGDNSLEEPLFQKFDGEHQCLLGLSTLPQARAFQLLGNLLLAPQSRLATLRLGIKFKQMRSREDMPDILVKMCGQFGRLSTLEWIGGARLTTLFAGCHLDQAGERLLRPIPIPIDDFAAWQAVAPAARYALWAKILTAPLSYPLIVPNQGQPHTDFLSPIRWIERLLFSLGRGLCPFSLQPLQNVPFTLPRKEAEMFLRLRRRIMAPLFPCGIPKFAQPLPKAQWTPTKTSLLASYVGDIYRDWFQV